MSEFNQDALQAIHDHIVQAPRAVLMAGAEVAPQLFILKATVDGKIEKMYRMPDRLAGRFFRDDASKNTFAGFLREMFTPGSPGRKVFQDAHKYTPNVVVQVNEAWVLRRDKFNPGDPLPRPSESPDREEVLLISIHTRDYSLPVVHKILAGPRRLEDSGRFHVEDGVTYSGRFTAQDNFDPDVAAQKYHAARKPS